MVGLGSANGVAVISPFSIINRFISPENVEKINRELKRQNEEIQRKNAEAMRLMLEGSGSDTDGDKD